MADWTMKKNDTWPPLAFTLSDAAGPVDLTDAQQVMLRMKLGRKTVHGICSPAPDQDAHPGAGTYSWVPEDTSIVGKWRAEFEVTWVDGTVVTFPNDDYLEIEIVEDLG
jgi:hypothetical protein